MSTVSRRSCKGGLRAHIVNQGAVWHPDIWNTKIIKIIIIINFTTGIFEIFPKDDREFVTFKTGKPGGPGYKYTKYNCAPKCHMTFFVIPSKFIVFHYCFPTKLQLQLHNSPFTTTNDSLQLQKLWAVTRKNMPCLTRPMGHWRPSPLKFWKFYAFCSCCSLTIKFRKLPKKNICITFSSISQIVS